MDSIARVTVSGKKIPVEITYYFVTGDGRRLARVHALSGHPFQSWSHGGWTENASANVQLSSIEVDQFCTCTPDGDACNVCRQHQDDLYRDEFPFSEATK